MGIAQGRVLGQAKVWQWVLETLGGLISLAIVGCLCFVLVWIVVGAIINYSWETLGMLLLGRAGRSREE